MPENKLPPQRKVPVVPRRGYSVTEWCVAFGRSRDTAYKLMRAGKLRYVDLGGRRFIPNEAAEALLTPD